MFSVWLVTTAVELKLAVLSCRIAVVVQALEPRCGLRGVVSSWGFPSFGVWCCEGGEWRAW